MSAKAPCFLATDSGQFRWPNGATPTVLKLCFPERGVMNRLLVGLTSLGLAASALTVAVPAEGAARLPCSARMSNASPVQNSRTDVLISTAVSAAVSTIAHYKTTNTTHTATADRLGRADVPYRISRATKGYRVVVTVTVRKGAAAGSCSTSFVPR
jgi:hypothetical protein